MVIPLKGPRAAFCLSLLAVLAACCTNPESVRMQTEPVGMQTGTDAAGSPPAPAAAEVQSERDDEAFRESLRK